MLWFSLGLLVWLVYLRCRLENKKHSRRLYVTPSCIPASVATIVALVLSMMLDMPGTAITWNYSATSYDWKLFSCLSFNIALTIGVHIMELHDASGTDIY